jgi:ribonuclease R
MGDIPSRKDLIDLGRHISFTERRSADAEKELRQIKIMELLERDIGEVYTGVVTGVTNFGIFVQIQPYLIDGLIRYERLMDDWWDVDERAGCIRGQRTGIRIRIGDVVEAIVARVDVPRRELDLQITKLLAKPGDATANETQQDQDDRKGKKYKGRKADGSAGGGSRSNARSGGKQHGGSSRHSGPKRGGGGGSRSSGPNGGGRPGKGKPGRGRRR